MPTSTLENEPAPVANVTISYATASDRLNVSTASPLDSGQGTGDFLLPNLTESTLELQVPHPSGNAELAKATLTTQLKNQTSSGIADVLPTGWGDGESSSNGAVVGKWELDIPAWQVEAIRQQLQKEKFFRRSRVLNAEVELSFTDQSGTFAKSYHAVPELDALLLRVAREGMAKHLSRDTKKEKLIRRLPPT